MSEMMRAVAAEGFGPPENLRARTLPVPEPGPGQLLVRIAAAAANPADLRSLSGVMGPLAPLTFPYVPGIDFAGEVVATGTGVTRFRSGDAVFGLGFPYSAARLAAGVGRPPPLSTGSMAEYAVVDDTAGVAAIPAGLDPVHAAALPVAGLTALSLLAAADVQPGETVLVVGASGGVGTAAVPLLAAAKAHVIATARPEDTRYVETLGATGTVGYPDGDPVDAVLRIFPDGVDALVNLALPGDRAAVAARVVRTGGRLLSVASPCPAPDTFGRPDLAVHNIMAHAGPGWLDRLAAAALDGTLPVAIGRRYPLEQGAQAFRDLAHRHTVGKLVVLAGPARPDR
jgi:NADPH2:quinone reductase